MSAVFGTDEKEPHESELSAITDDGSATHQITIALGGDETLGVRGPEYAGIVQTRIPAFASGPVDQHVQLLTAHISNQQIACAHDRLCAVAAGFKPLHRLKKCRMRYYKDQCRFKKAMKHRDRLYDTGMNHDE